MVTTGFTDEVDDSEGSGCIDEFFGPIYNRLYLLGNGKVGGIQHACIGGLAKGANGTIFIAMIPLQELVPNRFGVGWDPSGQKLLVATLYTSLYVCAHKYLEFGMGKDDGTDISAVHDHATVLAEPALLGNQPLAHPEHRTDLAGKSANLRTPKLLFQTAIPHIDHHFLAFSLQMQGKGGKPLGEFFLLKLPYALLPEVPRYSPVHGA